METAISRQKAYPLWKVVFGMLLCAALISTTGNVIGSRFFWTELDLRRLDKQIAYYQQLVDAEPMEPEHRVNLGYTLLRRSDYARALIQMNAAVEIDKTYMPAYLNAGYVYQAMELWDEALVQFHKVTELAPEDYRGFFNMGVCFMYLEMYNDALDMYHIAKLLRPGASDVAYYTGMNYELMGLPESAVDEYVEALTFNSKYKEAQEAINRLTGAGK
ncbi:MAG: tetratricopeptide repeat protein [Dethiobacter sp.]|jgi:tetratricopeptide (TPR) repeat protein|nr:tetratricopeptide repeat protein [Dethiobacter sp.]